MDNLLTLLINKMALKVCHLKMIKQGLAEFCWFRFFIEYFRGIVTDERYIINNRNEHNYVFKQTNIIWMKLLILWFSMRQ